MVIGVVVQLVWRFGVSTPGLEKRFIGIKRAKSQVLRL
jgi:hypothetical protein